MSPGQTPFTHEPLRHGRSHHDCGIVPERDSPLVLVSRETHLDPEIAAQRDLIAKQGDSTNSKAGLHLRLPIARVRV